MHFEPDNKIVKLCVQGMDLEGEGKNEEASKVFFHAWDLASNDQEKFTAAHYVARHQQCIADKLIWDEIALSLALKIKDDSVKGAYPSLYLNIGKGHEDLKDFVKAAENYRLALRYAVFLSDDGYGDMIRSGIARGIERLQV